LIVEDDAGRISARNAPPTAKADAPPETSVDAPPTIAPRRSRLDELADALEAEANAATEVDARPSLSSRNAQLIAWSVAAVCLLALLPLLFTSSAPVSPPAAPPLAIDALEPRAAETTTPPVAPVKPLVAEAPAPLPETAAGRLSKLGELLLSDFKSQGRFPAGSRSSEGLAAAQRWSWLAELEARRQPRGAPAPHWDRPWRDHVNDRFVRRNVPLLQNPRVKTKAGGDGYPASHFVGVAGVGKDAPKLPVNHPRAGIFGDDRRTTQDDIKDGTSQTMLLAGVQEEMGSWAASGGAAIRPFAREPYVNGPDGFGTGESESMEVLMADGSVKSISKSIAPAVVRRMAAMADGLPLDPAVPGEPGDRPPPATSAPTVPQVALSPAAPDLQPRPLAAAQAVPNLPVPGVVPPKPAPPPLDVQAALGQRVKKIEQSKPARLTDLLLLVEELSGVPIKYSREELGLAAAKLDEQISFTLDAPTAGDVLRTILERAGLDYRIEPNRIQIIPLSAAPKVIPN
jgi:hypothetical protein